MSKFTQDIFHRTTYGELKIIFGRYFADEVKSVGKNSSEMQPASLMLKAEVKEQSSILDKPKKETMSMCSK